MHQSHVEEDMKYAYCLRPVVAGTVNINNPDRTVNEHMSVVYSLRLSLTYPKCLKHSCANSVLMLEVALVPLCLPVRDRADFEDTRASGERFTTFPISHRLNNSTFNIETDGLSGREQ